MPRRDTYHEIVVDALIAEGWTITHDPYILEFGSQELKADLGAEMPIGAEQGERKIVVEIKSFLGASAITDLYAAYGQFEVYRFLLSQVDPVREIYLAMPTDSYRDVFTVEEGRAFREAKQISLILYRSDGKGGLEWIE